MMMGSNTQENSCNSDADSDDDDIINEFCHRLEAASTWILDINDDDNDDDADDDDDDCGDDRSKHKKQVIPALIPSSPRGFYDDEEWNHDSAGSDFCFYTEGKSTSSKKGLARFLKLLNSNNVSYGGSSAETSVTSNDDQESNDDDDDSHSDSDSDSDDGSQTFEIITDQELSNTKSKATPTIITRVPSKGETRKIVSIVVSLSCLLVVVLLLSCLGKLSNLAVSPNKEIVATERVSPVLEDRTPRHFSCSHDGSDGVLNFGTDTTANSIRHTKNGRMEIQFHGFFERDFNETEIQRLEAMVLDIYNKRVYKGGCAGPHQREMTQAVLKTHTFISGNTTDSSSATSTLPSSSFPSVEKEQGQNDQSRTLLEEQCQPEGHEQMIQPNTLHTEWDLSVLCGSRRSSSSSDSEEEEEEWNCWGRDPLFTNHMGKYNYHAFSGFLDLVSNKLKSGGSSNNNIELFSYGYYYGSYVAKTIPLSSNSTITSKPEEGGGLRRENIIDVYLSSS